MLNQEDWRELTINIWRGALYVVAIAMAVYQLLYTQILLQDPTGHLITHLGLALTVIFLSTMQKTADRKTWHLSLLLLILSLIVTCYLMVEKEEILAYRTAIPAPSDLAIGVLIIIVLLVAVWMLFGKTLTIVALAAITYLFLGRFLPEPFTVAPISFERLLMWLSVELGTGKGVYGDILDLSATYLFLFIIFGGVLDAFGGTRFIMSFGRWIGSKSGAGPAMTALVGSSLLGTVTGSTAANITITGSFTIPMMKRSGYTSEQAAAIETVSSNGGQIIPPIMGATAFLMAGFANIPYIEIVKAAIIPALLYVYSVFLYIHLTVQKMKIRCSVEAEPLSGKKLLLDAPIFFIPLGVLVFLLVKGYTLPFIGFWSIVSIVVVGLITAAIRRDARLDLKKSMVRIVESVRLASEMAVICGLLGIIVCALVTSGLGIKLPLAIEELSHGYLIVALVIAMISSILLGMGVPTAAAYILVAIGAVPVLLKMGVPVLAAHLFCFFFAISSHITPPVAVGALVASKIAGADYWRTSKECIKAAFVTFLLPYLFIYAPIVILAFQGSLISSLIQLVSIFLAIAALEIGLLNYCFSRLSLLERIGILIAGILFLTHIFLRNEISLIIGLVLFVAIVLKHFLGRGRQAGNPLS